MELEIGMYVRTINGKIWIIKSQQAISGHRKDIINASYNIIDLIELGDYVNGKLVSGFDYQGTKRVQALLVNYNPSAGQERLKKEDIKSIVTKEQFSQIEYRIGDD